MSIELVSLIPRVEAGALPVAAKRESHRMFALYVILDAAVQYSGR
jgi:hypothetical protein